MNYLDIHAHHPRPEKRANQIISLDIRQALDIGFEALGPFSIGIHPWYIDELVIDDAYQLIEDSLENPFLMSLGEMGIDRTIAIPVQRQVEVLQKQIEIAIKQDIPSLIFHCVRAYPDILNCVKKNDYKGSLIFHDYNGNPDMTAQLLKYNAFFSYGDKLFNKNSGGYRSFTHIPNHRILLESDDMADRRIEDVYQIAAGLLNIDLKKLDLLILENAESAFGKTLPPSIEQ